MMERERVKFTPLHLIRCLGDFALISLQVNAREIGELVDDAMDVWGDTDE